MAKVSVSENSLNSRPTSPPMNNSGVKAATSEMLIEITVKPIWRAPSMAARSGVMPFSRLRNTFSITTMASSTTKPTDTASAISEMLSIEKPATHISGAGAGQRQRHGDARRDRRGSAAQEQEHHHHHQRDGGEQRELHVADAGADRRGAVRQHRDLDVGRNPALELRQHLVDAVHRVDDVGVGLLGDDQQHRRLDVEPGRRAAVAHALLDRRRCRRAAPRCRWPTSPRGSGSRGTVRSWSLVPMVRGEIGAVEGAERRSASWRWRSAVRTSSMLTPIEAIATGLTRMRIAGCSAPLTVTSATPSTWAMRWAMTRVGDVVHGARPACVCEVSARIMIGAADGLTLRMAGSVGRSPGRSVSAALSAACTSRAAPSMLRSRSNWMVMLVEPSELDEVISVTPGISPSRRSSGAATVAAMMVGSAPGRLAETRMVGNSTVGMLDDRQEAVGHDAGEKQAERQQRGADRAEDEGLGEVHGAARGRSSRHDAVMLRSLSAVRGASTAAA